MKKIKFIALILAVCRKLCFVMVIVICIGSMPLCSIANGYKSNKPSTSDELQLQAFFEQTNNEGVKNGILFAGEKYNPNDVNTWSMSNREAYSYIADNIISTGGTCRIPQCSVYNGILNEFTTEIYFGFVRVQNPETGETNDYDAGAAYIPYSGTFQFMDSPEAKICLTETDLYAINCFGVKTLKVVNHAQRKLSIFNTFIDNKQLSVSSNIENGLLMDFSTDFSMENTYGYFTICHEYENVFQGWYDRETGELVSDKSIIHWKDLKEKSGNIILEARYNIEGSSILPMLYDINADKAINTGDAVCLLKQLVSSSDYTIWTDFAAYDATHDSKINTGDAVAILSTCVGLDN